MMNDRIDPVQRDRERLREANAAGGLTKLKTFMKLAGPGWIASAITLGGGSLASSLYLGVLGGYSLMWVQPFAMILGVIMLGAIGYVALSSGEAPFPAINRHVNPVLGWGWALAVAAANVIWCMPQNALAYSVLNQNLLPDGWLGPDSPLANWGVQQFGETAPWLAANFDKLTVAAVILVIATIVTWSYDRGGLGLRLYEAVLKIVVAIIVLCFFGVVCQLSFSSQPLDWSAIVAGFIPDFGQFFRPADTFGPYLDAVGEAGSAARTFWEEKIVAEQRDVMISAAATAVGINMTFMFPYTMLRKGWTREFRSLAIFDLATGMFIPYLLATSFVVIASAARFHTELPAGFTLEDSILVVDEQGPKIKPYRGLLAERDAMLADSDAGEAVDEERRLAAMLVRRDAMDLATSLEPLTGIWVANLVFGLGVLAMVLSTISILMLISGFVFAEMMNFPPGGWAHRLGTMVAGIGGAMWPFLWQGESRFFLAVVTSVYGFILLPFAYVTFVFLMNSASLLKDEMPRGWRRWRWNVLTIFAATVATIGAGYMIWVKGVQLAETLNAPALAYAGIAAVALYLLLAVLVGINRRNAAKQTRD